MDERTLALEFHLLCSVLGPVVWRASYNEEQEAVQLETGALYVEYSPQHFQVTLGVVYRIRMKTHNSLDVAFLFKEILSSFK